MSSKLYKFRKKECDFVIEIEHRQNFYLIGYQMHAGPNGIVAPFTERHGQYETFQKAINAACDICLKFFMEPQYTGVVYGQYVNVDKEIFDALHKIKYQPKDLFDSL